WAAVSFGSVFKGMEVGLPIVNKFAVTYGPVAFPLFGILAATVFILLDHMFRKRWIGWALFGVFALLAIFALKGVLFSGVIMVPTSGANAQDSIQPSAPRMSATAGTG